MKKLRLEDGLRFRIKQGVVPFELTTFRAVVSKSLLVEIEIITKRRGLGKESKALAFKPRNKEHNVLIPRHC